MPPATWLCGPCREPEASPGRESLPIHAWPTLAWAQGVLCLVSWVTVQHVLQKALHCSLKPWLPAWWQEPPGVVKGTWADGQMAASGEKAGNSMKQCLEGRGAETLTQRECRQVTGGQLEVTAQLPWPACGISGCLSAARSTAVYITVYCVSWAFHSDKVWLCGIITLGSRFNPIS